MKRVRFLALALVLLAGCTAGDQGDDDDTASTGTQASTPAATGPAPGVTDDSIQVGITYVDLAALGDVVDIDHGDYVASYQALIDDINADGGINGRTIETDIVGINPVGTDSAEAACVQLTEDDESFLVMGFFLDDAVGCIVDTHGTAAVGGSQTAELLARAQAPWFTAELGSDTDADAVRAMVDAGVLDGTVGVFSGQGDAPLMNDVILPLLGELGVEVADSAVNDTDGTDTNATNAQTAVIAERFESEDIDQVLLVGQSGLTWAQGTEPLGYRPELRFGNSNSVLAFTSDASAHDLSLLDGSIAGNTYGGDQNLYELPAMQDCIAVLEDAGVAVPAPDTRTSPDDPELHQAPFTACRDVALMRALLEAAGDDLNYGTFAAGADGLEVVLPTTPDPVTYGPPPSADGDIPIYLYDWDPDEVDFVLRED
jgi:hypothetical protein